MYYEEAIINGVRCWRGTPHEEWHPFTPEKYRATILALPIFEFEYREEVRDGHPLKIPLDPGLRAVWFEENEPVDAIDDDGVRWRVVGTASGRKRRRMPTDREPVSHD